MTIDLKDKGKNIIICLDGTDNQHGKNKSNILKLFSMLKHEPGKQVTYYDPGVGTMGDPTYKTVIARKINKIMGLAFGRGLMKNLIEAYTFLMEHYEDGDKVFIFGFSRGAYTARALAAFIKDCGLLERGAKNLLPYAMRIFLKKAPKEDNEEGEFFRILSSFRSTYGRLLNLKGDPKYLGQKRLPNRQLRIHFMGLFDTVKSYGWVSNPIVLRNEKSNPSVLNLRHALSIDEKRNFFRQMHWKASSKDQCKEVWFAGDHSDVGGGYSEPQSGLSKIALEWMVHEAINFGMKVDIGRYGLTLHRALDNQDKWVSRLDKQEDKGKYSDLNPIAEAHGVSLESAWKYVQLLPKKNQFWEEHKGMRTVKSEQERQGVQDDSNVVPILVHQSVIDRINDADAEYDPKNLSIVEGVIKKYHQIEQAISKEKIFTPAELEILRLKIPIEKKIDGFKEKRKSKRKEIKERDKQGIIKIIKETRDLLLKPLKEKREEIIIEIKNLSKEKREEIIIEIKNLSKEEREEIRESLLKPFKEEREEIIINKKDLSNQERNKIIKGIRDLLLKPLNEKIKEIKKLSRKEYRLFLKDLKETE